MKLKVITLLIFGLIITGTTLSQNIPNDIPKAFKTGDVQCLEKYMEDKILLTISGIKQQLPRPKAKEKLSAFFSKNIHQSEQNNSGYMIGKLTSDNHEFRVHILMKITDKKYIINQLRIENF